MLRRGLMIAISLTLLLSVAPAAASASTTTGPITWSAPAAIDAQPPFGQHIALFGLSCPSSSQCFAIDGFGSILTSTNPFAGSGAWQRGGVTSIGLGGLRCVGGPFCLAVQSNGSHITVAVSTDPAGGPAAWAPPQFVPVQDFTGSSCASASLCAIVDGFGNVWTSVSPGQGSWTAAKIDTTALFAISCPSTSLCVASDQNGNILYSTDPTGGPQAWSTVNVDTNAVDSITCTTAPFCWAGDSHGQLLHSNGALTNAWTTLSPTGSTQIISEISCSSMACAAVNTAGDLISTSTPGATSAATDWKVYTGDVGTFPKVACPPGAAGCLAVDQSGNGLISSAPGTGSWSVSQLDAVSNFDGLSCPSASFCVGVDNAGAVLTSTNPSGGASAWQRAFVSQHALDAVSCPSVSFCVLTTDQGDILTSTSPGGGAGAWSAAAHVQSNGIFVLSCPSASLCVGIDGTDKVWVSTDPAGGSGAWSGVSADPNQTLNGVSCPTATFCAAVDSKGGVVTSTNPAGGPGAWSAPAAADPGVSLQSISCSSPSQCLAVDGNGSVVASSSPSAGAWAAPFSIDSNSLDDVFCRPGATCVAVDSAGNALASTNPAGGPDAWDAPKSIDGGNFLFPVVCSPGLLCLTSDGFGDLVIGTPGPPSNTTPPAIAGTPAVGAQLTDSAGVWTADPTSFTYQWQDCSSAGDACTAIPGATAQSYTVQGSDAGHTIRVQETATNAGGSGTPAVSPPTALVAGTVSGAGAGNPTPTPSGGPKLNVKHIRAVLLQAAVPHGPGARYARILAGHGFLVSFRGVTGGTLRIVWKSNGVVLASGTLRFTGAGQHKLALRLTRAGQRLLQAHARHLVATIVFTARGQTLSFSERFALR